eukprot:TRINITY_DN90811_c0_g1_i1.p1 TRINITY_DN90811_c0_g1~~TRINITY_DN90811_c0_g1_i1.p1  ORF type:complete len:676 (+),score=156.15 TRINITY_DN90811_c0_g1_i1:47-2074(+)
MAGVVGTHPRRHRADGCLDIETSVSRLQVVARSLASFAASPGGPAVLKIISDPSSSCPGQRLLSCDPVEVLDAFGLEGEVEIEILREAMEGLHAANFGRREQARLAMLAASTLSEAVRLRRSGLAAWTLRGGLRRGVSIAEASLKHLASKRLAVQAEALPSLTFPVLQGDLLEDEDDVDWFFEDAKVSIPAANPLPSPVACAKAVDPSSSRIHNGSPAFEDIQSVCAELCKRHDDKPALHAATSGSGSGKQCFVYAKIRPTLRTRCELYRGIICHVPQELLTARGSLLSRLLQASSDHSPIRRAEKVEGPAVLFHSALFLDADLTAAAYESCAPAVRRLKEEVVQLAPKAGEAITLQSTSAAKSSALADAVSALIATGTEAIFLSGEVSSIVAQACQLSGALMVAGVPARLLYALAEEVGADVQRGLPSAREFAQAKRAVQVELAEPSKSERDGSFSFPLLGFRQPLLPHQVCVGPDAENPYWELWARAEETDDFHADASSVSSAVVLEASCEAQLRQVYAELSDCFLNTLREKKEISATTMPSASARLPSASVWAPTVAASLEDIATSTRPAALLMAEESDALVAPWLAQPGDSEGDKAASTALANALHTMAAQEAEFHQTGDDEEEEEGDGDASNPKCGADPADDEESLAAATAVLRRAIRVADLLLAMDEFG